MIDAGETFDGTWPWRPNFHDRHGAVQHFIDEGPRDAPGAVVLLHGEPTWGYMWRHLIGPLSTTRRIVVPDYLGFGKSGDPADHRYTAAEHVQDLTSLLVDELGLSDITLVMHDWGGPIGTGFALGNPDRVRAVFATNTFLPLNAPGQGAAMAANRDSAWFRWARQAHHDGSLRLILGNAAHTLVDLMIELQTITRPEIITKTWVRAYTAHFTDAAACEGVIRFPEQIVAPEGPAPTVDAAAAAAVRAKPAMLALGLQDTALLPNLVRDAFQSAWPKAPVVDLQDAGHFTPEDVPGELLALLRLFLDMLDQQSATR